MLQAGLRSGRRWAHVCSIICTYPYSVVRGHLYVLWLLPATLHLAMQDTHTCRARPLESAHLTAAWHASNANVILPDLRTASFILLLMRDNGMLMPAVQQWYNQSSLVEFYQDDNIRAGVKSYMGKIIMRNNTITGRLYRDEPAILAWDIMNEPQFPGDDTGKLLTVSCLWLTTICLGSDIHIHVSEMTPAACTSFVCLAACSCVPWGWVLGCMHAFSGHRRRICAQGSMGILRPSTRRRSAENPQAVRV